MSNLSQEQIEAFYEDIANGDKDALAFIIGWQTYSHEFDDLVDEGFDLEKGIKNNVRLMGLFTSKFFGFNSHQLLPAILLAAEAYKASNTTDKDTGLGEYLSHEGNNVLRVVALITGGFEHMARISNEIRRLTYLEHIPQFSGKES